MTLLMGNPMAKKKAAKTQRGRPPSDRGRRPSALSLKAWPEWSEWLEEFRQSLRAKGIVVNDSAGMVDLAMVALARQYNFRLPPER